MKTSISCDLFVFLVEPKTCKHFNVSVYVPGDQTNWELRAQTFSQSAGTKGYMTTEASLQVCTLIIKVVMTMSQDHNPPI